MDSITHSQVPVSHPAFTEDNKVVGALYLSTDSAEYRVTARDGALVIEVEGRGSISISPKSTAGIFISTVK